MFFNVILPPIIMFAAKNVKQSLFIQNFHYITFLGLVGTIFTFVCIFSFISVLAHQLKLFPALLNGECR